MRKTILLLSLVLFSFHLIASNHYFSNTGNDNAAGTSPVSAWLSISKLGTLSYSPGDTVFFESGSLFRGNINSTQGGNASAQVVFTSYGSGNRPIICGSDPVSNWDTTGNSFTKTYSGSITNLFLNGKEQTLARYPNEHVYLTLDSAQPGYLKDASLASINSSYITGSKVCVHSSQWSWEKANVSSYANPMLTYGNSMVKANPNYGYFLFDNLALLDTANEWKFDSAGQAIHFIPPSGGNPNINNVEVSIRPYGIEFSNGVSYVTINGLAFENQANSGIFIGYGTNKHIAIDNCSFSGQYYYGINSKGKSNQFSNSNFRDIDGMAVYIYGSGSGSTVVDHCTFRNIGMTRANGIGGQLNGTALMCASDSNYFHHNDIDSIGYCGISADGVSNLVERNIVDHAVMMENDGGGIKSWGAGSNHSTIRNNFIFNSDGNTEGTYQASFSTPAIYYDFSVNNCTISNNTVYNHHKKGIFQNSSNYNNTISYNVILGGSNMLDLNGSSLAVNYNPITGMTITHNSFFSKDSNSVIIRQVDYSNSYNMGTIDSNYYFQPYKADHYALRIGATPPYKTFAQWQSLGNDLHTRSSFVQWTAPIAYDTIFMNPTDNVVTINLGNSEYLDLDSAIICGSITLQPFTSQILINANVACTTEIDQIITENGISIYPNPAANELNLGGTSRLIGSSYTIIDSYGRVVISGFIHSESEVVNIENISRGIYFISIQGAFAVTKKFVKD